MTIHDESNLDLLEDDLRELARPRESDERLRLTVRAQLAGQLRPTRHRRLALRFALPAAAALAAAIAAAVVMLVGTSGSGGPAAASAAVVHHALRAVTPPSHTILHVKVTSAQFVGEWWQETSPPYASRGMKGETGHVSESADDGTTTYYYDPAANTLYEQPDASPPTFTDPISGIQQELANGRAQLAGTTVIDGQSLYEIDLPNGLVAYFDRSTYAPRYLDDPQRGGGVVRLKVVAYERLAPTPANLALLDMRAQHPGARIDTNPKDVPGK